MKLHLYIFLAAAFLVFSCNPKNEQTIEEPIVETNELPETIEMEAEAFTDRLKSAKTIELNGAQFIQNDSFGVWYAYNLEIKTAGRYRFEIDAKNDSGSVVIWMEDYADNKDGRTYDITGPITGINQQTVYAKDGSPLNVGIHKMKLHIDNGIASIDKFRFILIKERVETPVVLTQNMQGADWQLVWTDEFDQDGMPDESKWTYDIGNWGWGNKELQYYTVADKNNARIENGNLIIEAQKDAEGNWASARLTTREKETFVYGKIEIRAKVPVQKGNWSAGWMLGDAYIDELSWPYCGEIDILECVGYEIDDLTGAGKAHASVHCGAYYFKLGNHPTNIIDIANMKDEFHIYSIIWDSEKITAYLDNVEYFVFNDNSNELAWPFNNAQNIILNLAMGGGWGGAMGMDDSVTSQKLLVDYVRVYQRK